MVQNHDQLSGRHLLKTNKYLILLHQQSLGSDDHMQLRPVHHLLRPPTTPRHLVHRSGDFDCVSHTELTQAQACAWRHLRR
jgi:hypothetical protein